MSAPNIGQTLYDFCVAIKPHEMRVIGKSVEIATDEFVELLLSLPTGEEKVQALERFLPKRISDLYFMAMRGRDLRPDHVRFNALRAMGSE